MKPNTWQSDIKIGKIGESRFMELLSKYDIPNRPNPDTKLEYDIIYEINGDIKTAEVKYDAYSDKSGNFAFEYHNPKADRPSGIFATIADIVVYVTSQEIYACITQDIIAFMKNKKPDRNIRVGGCGNASLSLYKKERVIDTIFFRIDNIESKTKLFKLLGEK